MPELPEVETVRRGLAAHVVGCAFTSVSVREHRLRWPVDRRALHSTLPGRRVDEVGRRAKYLLLHLSGGFTLILHLGMSGKLLLFTSPEELHKHDHVVFHFDASREMRFRDPRRFGMIDLCRTADLPAHRRLRLLGLEPFDIAFTPEHLAQRGQKSRAPVKNILMDASAVAGVGNIYANETLFAAGIHPATPASALTPAQWRALHRSLIDVLSRAIEKGGTTLSDFVDSRGNPGYFQVELNVYGRTGACCRRCQTRIERVMLAGRSTFFCPACQLSSGQIISRSEAS